MLVSVQRCRSSGAVIEGQVMQTWHFPELPVKMEWLSLGSTSRPQARSWSNSLPCGQGQQPTFPVDEVEQRWPNCGELLEPVSSPSTNKSLEESTDMGPHIPGKTPGVICNQPAGQLHSKAEWQAKGKITTSWAAFYRVPGARQGARWPAW